MSRTPEHEPGHFAGTGYLVFLYVLLVAVSCFAGAVSGIGVPTFEEDGPLERSQIVLWGVAAIAALALTAIRMRAEVRASFLLFATVAAAAVARELDAHIYLNPATLGDYGVRYRIDWWLDGTVSLPLKLAWAGIGLAAALAILLPALFAWRLGVSLIRSRPLPFWLLAGTAAALFMGFAFDDLLRGKIEITLANVVEESAELVGPALYLGGVLALFRHAGGPEREG